VRSGKTNRLNNEGVFQGSDKKYDLIYADPPWRYEGKTATPSRVIENHYPTMELEDIKSIEVPSAKDCILYLWTTSPKIEEGLQVLNAWGFKYRSQLIWDKNRLGLGYWFRVQHEILLVGVKGKVSHPPKTKRIRSIYKETRGRHSKKPDSIRRLINDWYPDKTKLEMFTREAFQGWDTHGNEVSPRTQTYLIS